MFNETRLRTTKSSAAVTPTFQLDFLAPPIRGLPSTAYVQQGVGSTMCCIRAAGNNVGRFHNTDRNSQREDGRRAHLPARAYQLFHRRQGISMLIAMNKPMQKITSSAVEMA
jgi:hypothetical protein